MEGSNMKIGFVGAGRMGFRMIGNLLHHRHEVCVFDSDEAALRRVAARGASAAASLAEVARQEIVITMLPTPDVSVQVYEGAAGLFALAPPETLLLECSTVDVVTVERLGKSATRAGAQLVDAPLTGGVEGAEAGTLTFMVGGTVAQVTRIRPVLEAMGERIVHTGPFGSGSKMKLVNNMICATNLMVAAEALTLGLKLGLDAQSMYDVIANGTGQSWVFDAYYPLPGVVPGAAASRRFGQPTFPVTGMAKDMRCALDAARGVDAITPLHNVAENLLRIYCQHFDRTLDWTAVSTMFGSRRFYPDLPGVGDFVEI
ncbi:NAD(P)-dependent oxidoreductase [Caballeronia sp. NCTM1]|uniref:NAD(P)-dependent oxidoreductase n=1 Tax=Caballeronia sp. NCTM1 TaxID=2921753 RepID=UPI00202772DF|nr:NAD(P)-dependent oxidoreductase [Caballeronia sp. NCTM1]